MSDIDQETYEAIIAPPPFAELAGIRVLSGTPDLVINEMPVTEALANRNGVLHGGALMTLADNGAGTAAALIAGPERTNVTIESKTNFTRPVQMGDVVTGRCETRHKGRTIVVFHITMTRQDGKTVAITTQTHMLMDWKK